MKITYDPEVDILQVIFSDAPVEESDERMPNPLSVEYAVAG